MLLQITVQVPVVHPRRHQTSRNSRHLSSPIERKNVLMLETVPDERLAAESLEERLSKVNAIILGANLRHSQDRLILSSHDNSFDRNARSVLQDA